MHPVQKITGGVCAPLGFQAAGVHCGVKPGSAKEDLALIYSEKPATVACVYTLNKVQGAPIAVTKCHVADGAAQAIVCNSGNANTCNADGEQKALQMCQSAAQHLGLSPQDVIVASTGVIGQPLPIEPIASGMPALCSQLSPNGSTAAARAIMTTDTAVKETAVSFSLGGKTCHVGGIAKGSGMIHPNMATMLCFITTDACISSQMLQKALSDVVQDTFNMISVDGDTSTNDMVAVLANGEAKNPAVSGPGEDFDVFHDALCAVMTDLCRAIAADGEGATKLLTCQVQGAPDKETARVVAKSVITSSLFKAAMFGADANWGRILCAIGYASADFDVGLVSVDLSSAAGTVAVCRKGSGVPFDEQKASTVLQEKEIVIDINLHAGAESATAWGCDLTYDYVKINGDYRT